MIAQMRQAAKACLFSTIAGLVLNSEGFALVDVPSPVRHADGEEAPASEPAPLATLGEARPIPVRTDASRTTSQKTTGSPKSAAKTKPKDSAKRPLTLSNKAPATIATPKSTPPVDVNREEEEAIEQTGALLGRPFTSQRPASPAATPSATTASPQPSSPPRSVEQELEALYRKNGRQMPEMNLREFQTSPTEVAPSQMPAVRSAGNNGATAGSQTGVRGTKPNFFERIFGAGRNRPKIPPRTSAPQPPKAGTPAGQSSYGPYAPNATRPAPQANLFRPTPTPVVTPTAPPVAAPVYQPQPTPAREPAPLAPSATPTPQYQQPSPPSGGRPAGRSGLPLLDESGTRGDTESLDLSDDDDNATEPEKAPQILPKQTANGAAESPYTGLKITPNESEDSIARSEELGKVFSEGPSFTLPSVPANPLKDVTAKTPPAATGSALQHPLAGTVKETPKETPKETLKETPKSPESPAAVRTDDDELMELEEEDDDDDEFDLDKKPTGKSEEETLAIPPEKKPAAVRDTAKAQPNTKPVPGSATPIAPTTPAVSAATPAAPAASTATAEKKESEKKEPEKSVAAGQKGFKGFCPVVLKDERKLIEARPQYRSEFRGKTYTFSSIEAKEAFEDDPEKYAPAGDGKDVVRLAGGEEDIEGSLEHAAWYRGKLYLFSSAASRREFVEAPAKFNVKE
jgi:YHS domain-containing protein